MKVYIYILLLSFFCSCEVLKTKRRVATDSTSVHKIDSTHVTTTNAGSKKDSTWWREIVTIGRDTTIYHNQTTVPVNNYYPTQIVREGGTFSREDYLRLTDSMNKNKVDTTHVTAIIDTKDKKSGAPTILLIFIGLGILLLFGVIGFILIIRLTNTIKTKL